MVAAYNAWEDAKAQVRLTKARSLHDRPLIGKALLQCRGERTKVIRYQDLDIRT